MAKVSEHANGDEHWEHQCLKAQREKGKGDLEGVAKEVECHRIMMDGQGRESDNVPLGQLS